MIHDPSHPARLRGVVVAFSYADAAAAASITWLLAAGRSTELDGGFGRFRGLGHVIHWVDRWHRIGIGDCVSQIRSGRVNQAQASKRSTPRQQARCIPGVCICRAWIRGSGSVGQSRWTDQAPLASIVSQLIRTKTGAAAFQFLSIDRRRAWSRPTARQHFDTPVSLTSTPPRHRTGP